jgi:phosphopantetheinyl transferase
VTARRDECAGPVAGALRDADADRVDRVARDDGPGCDADPDRDAQPDPVLSAGRPPRSGGWPTAPRPVVWRTRAIGAAPEPEELTWLSPAERDRADAFRHPGPRARFVAARALLRRTLEEVRPGVDGRAWSIPPTGPPRLEGGELHLSLAHADALAAVAVSERRPVGIDVEPTTRDTDVALPAWLTPSESADLAVTSSVRGPQLLQLWTAKEAVIKAFGGRIHDPVEVTRRRIEVAGTGRWVGPEDGRDRDTDLVAGHRRQRVGAGSATVEGQADPVAIAWYVVDGHHLVALAVCGPADPDTPSP